MQTGGLSGMYRALLSRNPAPIYRIEVWREDERIDTFEDDGLPILEGSIQASLSSRVTRRLNVAFPSHLAPVDNDSLLTPYGNQIIVRAGVHGYGGPDFLWPVFRGRIADVDVDPDGVQVRADDLAAELANSFLEVPRNSNTGQLVTTEWQDLVREAYPAAEFGVSDPLSERVPKMTWSDSRAAAADSIAEAAGAYWYTLGDGSFVMRLIPWTVAQDPLLTWDSSVDGVLTNGRYTLSRESVFNKITVVGEAADGTPPVSATVFDNDSTSPTYIYGPFGEKGRRIISNATTNSGAAFQLAERYLRRSKALVRTWSVDIVSDPALELGDCVMIDFLGKMDTQVVESFDIPLSGDNVMNVSLRALAPGTALEED